MPSHSDAKHLENLQMPQTWFAQKQETWPRETAKTETKHKEKYKNIDRIIAMKDGQVTTEINQNVDQFTKTNQARKQNKQALRGRDAEKQRPTYAATFRTTPIIEDQKWRKTKMYKDLNRDPKLSSTQHRQRHNANWT